MRHPAPPAARRLALPGLAALGAVALGLAGCNTPAAPPAAAAVSTAPTDASLPRGSDCADVISRYRAVVSSDASTGNLEQPVYRKIEKEVAAAEASCAAGHDAQAAAMVADSARRHGYPAAL